MRLRNSIANETDWKTLCAEKLKQTNERTTRLDKTNTNRHAMYTLYGKIT